MLYNGRNENCSGISGSVGLQVKQIFVIQFHNRIAIRRDLLDSVKKNVMLKREELKHERNVFSWGGSESEI